MLVVGNDDGQFLTDGFEFGRGAAGPPIFGQVVAAAVQPIFRAGPAHRLGHIIDVETDEILHDGKVGFAGCKNLNLHGEWPQAGAIVRA